MITYNLSDKATAFTTTRSYGRDKDLLCPELRVPAERFARPHQVHGTVVRQLAEEFFTLPENIRTMLLDGVDAVIYDVKDACVGISTADCIPVLAMTLNTIVRRLSMQGGAALSHVSPLQP